MARSGEVTPLRSTLDEYENRQEFSGGSVFQHEGEELGERSCEFRSSASLALAQTLQAASRD